jgi:ankyrin repeat protein
MGVSKSHSSDTAMNPSPHASSSRTSTSAEYNARVQNPLPAINAAQENLIYAIKNKDETNFDVILDIALSEGACLSTVDKDGFIPLEIAVRANKPRIVQSLLSKGSPLPLVHQNGFDLAMLAASQGNTAMLLVLLDTGDMLPDAQDASGMTALHYAVIGGHLQCALALLDREADINIYMTGDIDPATRRLADIPEGIGNKGTTALMLAVALKNHVLTDLLLTRGASPFCGARHPIEITILNNDLPMLDLLLSKNIDPNQIILKDGRSLLTLSIESNCSLALIKKLLPPNLHMQDGLNTHSPLHSAMLAEQDGVAARSFQQSERVDSDNTAYTALWALTDNQNNQVNRQITLAPPRADNAVSMFTNNGISLSNFCQFASQPAAFSSYGIFPEALASALPALQNLQGRSHNLSGAQIEFEVAYCLHNLKKREVNVDATSLFSVETIMNVTDEQSLMNENTNKINVQIGELKKIGDKFLTEKINSFSHILSRNFFSLMLGKCPNNTDLTAFIQNKLTQEDGLPLNAAEHIATAWVNSYNKSKQLSFLSNQDTMLLQCTENHMIFSLENKLMKKINQFETTLHRRSFCLNELFNTLTKRHAPIKQFVTDPVAFLRLLPPSPAEKNLTQDQFVALLCGVLGLSANMSQKIHGAWALACDEARTAIPSGHPGRVYDFLSRAMAASLKLMLHGPRDDRPDGEFSMPVRLQGQLLQWCNTILAQQDEDETDSIDQQRPQKRARIENE